MASGEYAKAAKKAAVAAASLLNVAKRKAEASVMTPAQVEAEVLAAARKYQQQNG